ncbi:hypothetical protein [Agrobacterium sp.]|uniref:hypothetical protein n=1 Tax=Agrobacterium sp. TaxID=361 RepID=UPI00289CDCAD|nr:hypothetical protein [Agrobacterium sp.]
MKIWHAFVIGFSAVAFAYVGPSLLNWTWCVSGQCSIQGWMAASSGWIAAVAAFATIVVLRKQHADIVYLQSTESRALASKTVYESQYSLSHIAAFSEVRDLIESRDIKLAMRDYRSILQTVERHILSQTFDEFISKVGIDQPKKLVFARDSIRLTLIAWERPEAPTPNTIREGRASLQYAKDFYEHCDIAAQEFLNRLQ